MQSGCSGHGLPVSARWLSSLRVGAELVEEAGIEGAAGGRIGLPGAAVVRRAWSDRCLGGAGEDPAGRRGGDLRRSGRPRRGCADAEAVVDQAGDRAEAVGQGVGQVVAGSRDDAGPDRPEERRPDDEASDGGAEQGAMVGHGPSLLDASVDGGAVDLAEGVDEAAGCDGRCLAGRQAGGRGPAVAGPGGEDPAGAGGAGDGHDGAGHLGARRPRAEACRCGRAAVPSSSAT